MQERRWHVAVPMLVAAIGFVGVTLVHGVTPMLIALCASAAGALTATATFWSLPTAFLSGAGGAVGIAVINSVGNIAGFASPFVIGSIRDHTKNGNGGMLVLSMALLLGVAGVLRIPAKLVNR